MTISASTNPTQISSIIIFILTRYKHNCMLTQQLSTIFIIWSIFIQFVMLRYHSKKARLGWGTENWKLPRERTSAVCQLWEATQTINNIICQINSRDFRSRHESRKKTDRNTKPDTGQIFLFVSCDNKLFLKRKFSDFKTKTILLLRDTCTQTTLITKKILAFSSKKMGYASK